MLTRRQFIKGTSAAALSAAWLLHKPRRLAARPPANPRLVPATDKTYAFFKAGGSPHDLGLSIGKTFGPDIKKALRERAEWFKPLREFAVGEGAGTIQAMQAAARKHTPAALEELEGWAKGADLDFVDLFTLNAKSEIQAFIDARCGCAGCSTVVVKGEDSLIVTHNEDGHQAYRDRMFVLHVEKEDGTRFVGLTYPGIMEGNAPWVNSHGVLMTTNYIPSKKVAPGIPRYFLDRTAMEATSVGEVLSLVQHPERAYGYHHVVASLVDKRAFSVEATPTSLVVKEIEGLFYHTNHLIWESMKSEPQFDKYIGISSKPRFESVAGNLGGLAPESVDVATIMKALSSHDGAPWSVCRHPDKEATGATLSTAVFEAPKGSPGKTFGVTYYKGQPCLDRATRYEP